MNKDLAGLAAIWRALHGVRGRHFCCFICVLVVLLSKSRRRCFAANFGSVSGDGRSFRCCTVGELLRDCDLVSVMAVREKCDERGLRDDLEVPQCWVSEFGRAPLRLSPSASLGASAKQGRLSRKAREGAHPQLISVLSKSRVNIPSLNWPIRQFTIRRKWQK